MVSKSVAYQLLPIYSSKTDPQKLHIELQSCIITIRIGIGVFVVPNFYLLF